MKPVPRSSQRKIKVNINLEGLPVFFFREGHNYVAVMPTLDLTTCGETMEEAQKMASEAALAFIEECIKMRTLDEILQSLGWQKKESTGQWLPPAFVAHHALNLNLGECTY